MPDVAHNTLKGRYVQFRIRDIHLPQLCEALDELYGAEIVEGRVVDVSDGGREGSAFVVIEVAGLRQPCILAVERVLRTL